MEIETAERVFAAPGEWPTSPRYNLAPSQRVPVIVHDGTRRVCRAMKWGLVPGWARDASIGNRLVNARSETAASKPAFRDAMRNQRCIIPASGFYEWAPAVAGGRKQPMAIRPADHGPMAMAGLWSSWRGGEGEPLTTCTILTRCAIAQLAPIHHRMPVLLRPESWEAWLDPVMTDPAASVALMDQPCEGLVAYPVSTRVNSPSNDDAALLEPIEPETDSLFG